MPNSLLIVHVDVSVLPDRIDDFLAATEVNATATRQEVGVVRFDVLQDHAKPGHLVLVEIYRDEKASIDHKATGHYQQWRDSVEAMMARPRQSTRFVNVSPDDTGW